MRRALKGSRRPRQPSGRPGNARTAAAPRSGWAALYTAAGACALGFVVCVVVPLVLIVLVPQPPLTGGAAVLQYIGSHRGVYIVELVCFVDLGAPALVVFLALGVALFDADRVLAVTGGLVGIVSEAAALALGASPPSLHGGLVYLADRYATAGSEPVRAAIAAGAEGLVAMANAVSIAGVLTAAGILLLSLAMLRGVFCRTAAWIGIGTGILGIVSEPLRPLIGMAYAAYGLLLPSWFGMVGWKLFRLGRR